MVMSWIFAGIIFISILFSLLSGNGGALSAALMQGAQSGIRLALSLAGSMCLWTGVGNVLEKTGLSAALASLFRPLLVRLFPSAKENRALGGALSANLCANFLGLGNAATPMGIRAVGLMKKNVDGQASDEMCRLIVLNTASIQLIPTNVAAVRAALGCESPFDILGAVWVTSLCAVTAGLLAAFALGKLWHRA